MRPPGRSNLQSLRDLPDKRDQLSGSEGSDVPQGCGPPFLRRLLLHSRCPGPLDREITFDHFQGTSGRVCEEPFDRGEACRHGPCLPQDISGSPHPTGSAAPWRGSVHCFASASTSVAPACPLVSCSKLMTTLAVRFSGSSASTRPILRKPARGLTSS